MTVAATSKHLSPDQSWLSEAPPGWPVVRLRFRATINPSRSELNGIPGETEVSFVPMEAVCEYGGLRLDQTKSLEDVSTGYTYFRDGDIVVAKITPCFENSKGSIAVGLKNGLGFGTTELHVLRPSEALDRRFLFYLTISHPFRSIGAAHMYGAGGQKRVPGEFVRDFRHPIPLLDEQRAIATFLDRETARIDSLIKKKQRQMELLNEKRSALISHAVTKGLDPNAPMKDSGIDWLGEVPAHWVVMSLKMTAKKGYKTFTDGDWIEAPFIEDDGIRLLQTGNVGIGEYREKGFRYISTETFQAFKCSELLPSDVLICRLDGPVGRACLAPDLGVRMITSVDNAILRPASTHDPRFLVYFMSSKPWIDWIGAICRVGGGFRLRISRSMLGDQKVAIPPLDEQRVICETLDEGSHRITKLVTKIDEGIELLREYRTTLISAAVTGNTDVRQEVA